MLARTALVLAVLHPFLYRSPFAPARPWDPTSQLTLSDNFAALGSGALALAILPGLVLIAIALGVNAGVMGLRMSAARYAYA